MLIHLWIHGIDHPITRDVEDCNKLMELIEDFGKDRIEKISITDLRSLAIKNDKASEALTTFVSKPIDRSDH